MIRFQADVGLFSEPKRKASPRLPTKPPKKAAIESHAIPATLVPARSISGPHGTSNSASQQRSHNSPSKPTQTPLPPGLVPARKPSFSQPSALSPAVTSALLSSKPSAESSVANSSRPAPAPSGPPTGSGPTDPTQKPRPPPQVKRPKQPSSLFIPKKVHFNRSILITFNQRIHS
jgi:hypothetical protein